MGGFKNRFNLITNAENNTSLSIINGKLPKIRDWNEHRDFLGDKQCIWYFSNQENSWNTSEMNGVNKKYGLKNKKRFQLTFDVSNAEPQKILLEESKI